MRQRRTRGWKSPVVVGNVFAGVIYIIFPGGTRIVNLFNCIGNMTFCVLIIFKNLFYFKIWRIICKIRFLAGFLPRFNLEVIVIYPCNSNRARPILFKWIRIGVKNAVKIPIGGLDQKKNFEDRGPWKPRNVYNITCIYRYYNNDVAIFLFELVTFWQGYCQNSSLFRGVMAIK